MTKDELKQQWIADNEELTGLTVHDGAKQVWSEGFDAGIKAERERADKLNAALVEIEQRYLENPNKCTACYDLASIATLNKDIDEVNDERHNKDSIHL